MARPRDPPLLDVVQSPLAYQRVGRAVATGGRSRLPVPLPSWIAYFWGLDVAFAKRMYLDDGRLFNNTQYKNFGQEGELVGRMQAKKIHPSAHIALAPASFVFHYRGATLGRCKNGHTDCASWQVGHRPDFWSPGEMGHWKRAGHTVPDIDVMVQPGQVWG